MNKRVTAAQIDEPAHEAARPVTLSRRYPAAPLVGVAAAVFDATGRVLLVQRGRPPAAGSWGLPGGLLDLGEKLADGARREVREECGIEIAVGSVVGVFEPLQFDDQGRIEYHYVVVDFWASRRQRRSSRPRRRRGRGLGRHERPGPVPSQSRHTPRGRGCIRRLAERTDRREARTRCRAAMKNSPTPEMPPESSPSEGKAARIRCRN